MTDEQIAALERLISDTEARGVLGVAKDKAIIRDFIEALRVGGISHVLGAATVVGEKNGAWRERAQIVTWLHNHDFEDDIFNDVSVVLAHAIKRLDHMSDAIEAGAHEETTDGIA